MFLMITKGKFFRFKIGGNNNKKQKMKSKLIKIPIKEYEEDMETE